MSILPIPFADYFNVSLPLDAYEQCREAVLGVAYSLGGYVEYDGLCRLGDGGTVKYGHRQHVGWISFSGAALACLRQHGQFLEVLSIVGTHPHRVTTLHATLDVVSDAPVVLEDLYRKGAAHGVYLTRKRTPPTAVKRAYWGPGLPDGRETGTINFGKRGAGVWAKAYDKRSQLLSKAVESVPAGSHADIIALNDPGPLTRYEVSLGRNVGCSLRDVADPTAVFWHHAWDLLPRPENVAPWAPACEGYALPPPREPDYVLQLSFLLEHSPDIRKAVQLAEKLGPHGEAILFGRLRRLRAGLGPLLAPAESAA